MAQKYQEQQLAEIKKSRNQVIDDLSNGTASTNADLSGLFGSLHLDKANGGNGPPVSSANGHPEINSVQGLNGGAVRGGSDSGSNGFGGSQSSNGNGQSTMPITLPRFVPNLERNGNGPQNGPGPLFSGQGSQNQNGSSLAMNGNNDQSRYGRQYSDTAFEQSNGYSNTFNNSNQQQQQPLAPPTSAGRAIRKSNNE
jgi:hypothetical protein